MPGDLPPSPIPVAGQPLHTRTLVLDVSRKGDGLRAVGEILDLRKCGFVPTGGDLQTAGFVHHMTIDLDVDLASETITRLEPAQPHLAFRACAATGGDSCSDPLPRLRTLVGARMDEGFPKQLSSVFGGSLGCSHLLTLAQLMGSVLPRILGALEGDLGDREEGERLWKNALVLDGCAMPDGALGLFIQSNEFETTARARAATPLERLARQSEVRVSAALDLDAMTLVALDAAERTLTLEDLDAPWCSRTPELADRIGGPAVGGLAGAFLKRFGATAADRPLLDALLNLSPGAIQCLAALSGRILAAMRATQATGPAAPAPVLGVGGLPDSCYMWRTDGPLELQRRPGSQEE